MNVIYKILIILILLIIIKIFIIIKEINQDNFNNIDLKSLTEEERKKLREELMEQHTDVRFLAATDIEAILNVTNIIKNGSIPIPKGTIVAYNSTQVPQGWALCDGKTVNGQKTPDLRNRFIVSTGNKYKINSTGGSADAVIVSHNHRASEHNNNNHVIPKSDCNNTATGFDRSCSELNLSQSEKMYNINTSKTGESGTNKNLPPYYALTYIMKV